MLEDILREVSRAFYLSMRVLPCEVRPAISVGYLLARAADTLADDPSLSAEERQANLQDWLRVLEGETTEEERAVLWVRWRDLTLNNSGITRGEARLLERLSEAYALFLSLDDFARVQVLQVLRTLISGMLLDLRSFPGYFSKIDELENYTYLVAGCVGEFWTNIMFHYLHFVPTSRLEDMRAWGVSFGQALQYTNILRDLPKDLQNGRSYVPLDSLHAFISKSEGNLKAHRQELVPFVERALEHFEDAFKYIKGTPKRFVLLRLSTIWPVAIGLGTFLEMAKSDLWPSYKKRIKVSRSWVYTMMALSLVAVWSNSLLDFIWEIFRKKIRNALEDR